MYFRQSLSGAFQAELGFKSGPHYQEEVYKGPLRHMRAVRNADTCFFVLSTLVLQAVSLRVLQKLQPLGELFAEALHVEIPVDLVAATLQATAVFWTRLLPALLWGTLRQAVAKPGHSGLM